MSSDATKKIRKPRALLQQSMIRIAREQLSEQQRAFCAAYVRNGGLATAAARDAGYREHDRENAYNLVRMPAIQSAIRAEQARVIGTEGATVAIGTILAIMRDDRARNSDRLAASRLMLEAARIVGKGTMADDTAGSQKPLAEMTAAELDNVIRETQRALTQIQQQARTIDGSANPLAIEPIPKPDMV